MRRLVLGTCVLALAGCGAKSKALENSQATKQAEAQAQQIASVCLKKGGGLSQMIKCAVPPHHGRQFVVCVLSNTRAANPAKVESVLVTCGEKYR